MYERIGVFGDSIVFGWSDYEKGGWVERLKVEMMKKDVEVYNFGISGDTSEGVLERIEKEIKDRGIEFAIISVGVNDSVYLKNEARNLVDLESFESNIKAIIDVCNRSGAEVIVFSITPVDERKTKPIPWDLNKSYSNEFIKKYNSVLEKVCLENNVKFLDLNEVLDVGDLEDGLHPNSNGHRKIFEKISGLF